MTNEADLEIVEKVFGDVKGPTKKVRVKLAAFTRVEWSSLPIDVPENATEAQLNELANRFYDGIDGGEYVDDPDYWERASCRVEDE